MIKVNQEIYDAAQDLLLAGRWRVDENRGILRPGSDGLAGSVNTCGYLQLRFTLHGRRVATLAHRVMWESVRGQIPDGLYVNHIDGDKQNNAIANLELVTHTQNMRHAHAAGLMASHYGLRGNPDPETVRAIFRAAWTEGTPVEVAARFGVKVSRVKSIKYRDRGEAYTQDLTHLMYDQRLKRRVDA